MGAILELKPVPTFENGWICRECWCANRESDARCYRCHAPQPDLPAAAFDPVTRMVVQPAEEAEAPAVAAPEAVAGTSFCLTCGQPMDAGARICSQCGTPAHELGSVVNAAAAPAPAPVVRAPREPALPKLRAAYVAFVAAHEVRWEEAMSALAVVSTLVGLVASRVSGSFERILVDASWLLTAVFVLEYASRLAAAEDRRTHFFTHLVDLVAVVPLLRLARVLRLFWLLVLAPAVARTTAAAAQVAGRVRHVRSRFAGLRRSKPVTTAQATAVATAQTTAPSAKPAPQLRSHRSLIWLVPVWAAAAVSSALFLLTTQHGQVLASLFVLISLGLFSAITAAITTISLDRRSHALREGAAARQPEPQREIEQLRDAGLVTPAEHNARRSELLRTLGPQ
jgi:hypothetical protein